MHLRQADFHDGTWKRLERELDDRLAELRLQLEGLTLTNDKTFEIRGRIDEVKRLRALSKSSAQRGSAPTNPWPLNDD